MTVGLSAQPLKTASVVKAANIVFHIVDPFPCFRFGFHTGDLIGLLLLLLRAGLDARDDPPHDEQDAEDRAADERELRSDPAEEAEQPAHPSNFQASTPTSATPTAIAPILTGVCHQGVAGLSVMLSCPSGVTTMTVAFR